MKVTDVIPKEKLMVFHKAAYEIIKNHLQENVATVTATSMLTHLGTTNVDENTGKIVHISADNFIAGMSTAMALIEEGIINIQTLEIQKKK